jgi:hypothetical protein
MSTPGEGTLICYPEALKTVERRAEVIQALTMIADELELGPASVPKPDQYGWVHFPVAQASLLLAVGRAVPDWRERDLFYPSDELP